MFFRQQWKQTEEEKGFFSRAGTNATLIAEKMEESLLQFLSRFANDPTEDSAKLAKRIIFKRFVQLGREGDSEFLSFFILWIK
jgi:hypothetical protein